MKVIEQNKDVESKLLHIFDLVNDWLRFAEAKNGALLAFCSACIFGLLKFPNDWITITSSFRAGLVVAIVFLLLAILICVWSFFPQITRIEVMLWPLTDECKETDNFLFFGDICTYSVEDLFDRLCERYSTPFDFSQHQKQYLHDLANQIIVNSKITMRKFRLFQRALGFVFCCIPAFFISWGIVAVLQHCFIGGF